METKQIDNETTKDAPLVNPNDNILIIDPLIEPLIDTDELKETIEHDDTLYRFEKKCESILTLNAGKQEQSTTVCCQIIRRCTGIFYAILGSFLFTCSGFLIKQLRVDFFDALLARSLLQTTIILAFVFYKKTNFIHGSSGLICLQIARSIIASSGLLLFYASYVYIPLPDLTTCRYTQVVWTAIIAMIVFRERISIATVLAIILTLTGVIFVAQPTFLFPNNNTATNQTKINNIESDKSQRILGLSLAIACALSLSFSIVFNKKLVLSKIPQSIIMLQFSSLNLCLLISYHIYNRFILLKYANQTMFTWQYFLAASISLIQVFSSTMNQCAIKLEHPSIISVAQSSDILFAIFLQNIFTNVKSNQFVIIGSFLVTASIFLVGINKFWKDQRKIKEKNQNI